MPDCVGDLLGLTTLNLQGSRALTCLPESLGKLAQLQKLNVTDCRSLATLPKSICNLTNLVAFSSRRCPPSLLASVREWLSHLPSLHQLWVDVHQPGELPPITPGVKDLRITTTVPIKLDGCRLETLNLEGTDISGNPDFSMLVSVTIRGWAVPLSCLNKNLQELVLEECTTDFSPIGGFHNLRRLEIHTSRMAGLPNLDDLARLHELSLCFCPNLSLFPEVSEHAPWKTLRLVGCRQLTEIPSWVFRRTWETLSLPTSVLPAGAMPVVVRDLDLCGRSDEIRPVEINFAGAQIGVLCVANCPGGVIWTNKADEPPVMLEHLTIETSELGQSRYPPSVLVLSLDACTGVTLENFCYLGNLVVLRIVDCHNIACLPEKLGYWLPKLTRFCVKFTNLSRLPDSIGRPGSCLAEVDLSYNQLTLLPSTLANLQDLRKLNLQENPLTRLPVEWCRLQGAIHLKVGGCRMIFPPRRTCRRGWAAVRRFLANRDLLTKAGLLVLGARRSRARHLPDELWWLLVCEFTDVVNQEEDRHPDYPGDDDGGGDGDDDGGDGDDDGVVMIVDDDD